MRQSFKSKGQRGTAESDAVGERRKFFNWRFVAKEERRVNRLAFILFWSILMYFFFKTYVVSVGIVTDISMSRTLPEGGFYLINKYVYRFVSPQRGEIAVLRRDKFPSQEYVKRIIGLPGETLVIRSGGVYINGRRLVEPYAVGATYPDFGPVTIEKDTYFVLGDNRLVSEDSRHYGVIPSKNIEGKIKPGEVFPFR